MTLHVAQPIIPMNMGINMNIPLTSVLEAGVAIRTLRKRAGIRIDDFALTAGVSKQFMTDLENGKPTIQMGMVLQLLQRLGVKIGLELPDAVNASYREEMNKAQSRQAFLGNKNRQPKQKRHIAADGNGSKMKATEIRDCDD